MIDNQSSSRLKRLLYFPDPKLGIAYFQIMTKKTQRRLRRRSPSDLSNSSSSSTQHHFVRSTTMEELQILSIEDDSKLQLDLHQFTGKVTRNEVKSYPTTSRTSVIGWTAAESGDFCFDESSSGEDSTSLSSVDDVEDKTKTIHMNYDQGSNQYSCRKTNNHHDSPLYLPTTKSSMEMTSSPLSATGICDDVISSFVIGSQRICPSSNNNKEELDDLLENHNILGTNIECSSSIDQLDDQLRNYKAKRIMTKTQERWNALTMIPNVVYCCYFLLSGCWLNSTLIEKARSSQNEWMSADATSQLDITYWDKLVGADEYGCLNYAHSVWKYMPALPPFPALMVAIGICLHAPFSFIYHWKYANRTDSLTHWSRRMDQAMIHVASAFMSYGTSGNMKYFLINCLYNIDCCYKQLFDPVVKPFRNQIRVFLSMVFYSLPILRRGDFILFIELWMMLGICGWLFATYPVGGWSHAIFHLVAITLPPLLMIAACDLPTSQHQMLIAAQCAIRSNNIEY